MDKQVNLSKAMQNALNRMGHSWQSAYELKATLTTLKALEKLGLIVSKHEQGHLFFPRTEIKWMKS